MSALQATSHFWIANPPNFSTTIMVAPGVGGDVLERSKTHLDIFDVDGNLVNAVDVEFPAGEVGVIELEPFTSALKEQGGFAHGHLKITSAVGTRHVMRQSIGSNLMISQDPSPVCNRENSFLPVVIGGRREHMLVLVNTEESEGTINFRLIYGNRSPEWTLAVPGNGSRVVAFESELIAAADRSVLEQGGVQAYLRFTAKSGSSIVSQVIERIVGEAPEHDLYRSLHPWS